MLDLSIIILNYNTEDWLENALASIYNFQPTKIHFEIIVVDNNSVDHSVEMVKRKFPEVRLIESPENGGFAKGNNIGIRQAKGKYIMLLNSDAEFTEETDLESMVDYLNNNEQVGVMTPKLILADGAIDLASHRGEPTPWAALTYFSKLEQLFPNNRLFGQYHRTWQSFDTIHEIEACSAAAMIVRASALKKVGLLDESFFMYAEDLDWCRRFREAGHHIIYFPNSTVIHHKYKSGRGKTAKQENRKTETLETKSFLNIPGFLPTTDSVSATSRRDSRQPTPNKAESHFWETMKQYYAKHYGKNNPIQTWIIHRGVDVVKFLKTLTKK